MPGNRSIERAFVILEYLSSHRGARLSDIAQATQLPLPTASRLLGTLRDLGYVQQQDRHFGLGPRMVSLARGAVADGLAPLIEQQLSRLADATGLTAFIAVRQADEVVYIHRGLPRKASLVSTTRIGDRAPLYCTGVGKIFLAQGQAEDWQAYCRRQVLAPLTEKTMTDAQSLQQELVQVRQSAHAMDDEECELGVRCLAVPVRDRFGSVVAACSVSGASPHLAEAKRAALLEHLQATVVVVQQAMVEQGADLFPQHGA